MYSMYLSYSFAFVGRERTLIRLGGKLIKVRPEFRIRFWELGEVFCQLRRESAREMIHEPFKGVGRVTHKLSLWR